METIYESLKLDNQLCFPLYAAARNVVKKYTPFLEKIDLTYTQPPVCLVSILHSKMNIYTITFNFLLYSLQAASVRSVKSMFCGTLWATARKSS